MNLQRNQTTKPNFEIIQFQVTLADLNKKIQASIRNEFALILKPIHNSRRRRNSNNRKPFFQTTKYFLVSISVRKLVNALTMHLKVTRQ